MTEIPDGWLKTQLGDLGTWSSGGTPSRKDPSYYGGDVPWIKTGDLNDGLISQATEFLTELGLSNSSAKIFPAGTLLIAMYGATIGKTGVLGMPAATNQACAALLAEDTSALIIPFLSKLLLEKANYLKSLGQGGAQPNISQEILKAVEILLPPLAEQRRIVAKLDGLLGRTIRARKELDRIPVLVARYKQVVLAAAYSGELTSDWRLERNVAQGGFVHLRDLCTSITDGDHQAPPRADSGVPFITISAMNDGRIRLEKATRFVPPSYAAGLAASRRPTKGDVLFSVTGSIAIPAHVETQHDFVFQRHIAILKPDEDKISGRYLALVLAAPQVRKQAEAVATGTAQLTVPLGGLRLFQVPSLTIDEQNEIVYRIEAAFAWLDKLAAEHARAAALLPKFEQALLAKAFRGELVAQDSNDEPASALLERIRAERAAAPERQRKPRSSQLPRAPRQKAAMTKSRLDQDVMHQPYLAKHLRVAGGSAKVEDLFRSADLPVTDFYKQLAWEMEAGHVNDKGALLEAA